MSYVKQIWHDYDDLLSREDNIVNGGVLTAERLNYMEDGIESANDNIGPQGPQGEKGEKGDKGDPGEKGEIGPQGPKGDPGETGSIGPQGRDGRAAKIEIRETETLESGEKARVSNVGTDKHAILVFSIPKGEQGPEGPTGQIGPQGEKGEQGETGPAGKAATISVGDVYTVDCTSSAIVQNVGTENNAIFNFTIPRGKKGEKGEQGEVGPIGLRGPIGPEGVQGPQGLQGEKGDKGDPGEAATISIGKVEFTCEHVEPKIENVGNATNAILNFTIPKGEQGEQGIQGIQGEKGDPGEAATISIGEVKIADCGEDGCGCGVAKIENVGNATNAILNFTLPRGPQGIQGEKGEQGETGPEGPQGPEGPEGPIGRSCTVTIGDVVTVAPGTEAYIENSGNSINAILDFHIPRGYKGEQGPQGEKGEKGDRGPQGYRGENGVDGKSATISIGEVSMIPSNVAPIVENVGSSTNAILNFYIPKGEKGDQGERGLAGAVGPQGPQGAKGDKGDPGEIGPQGEQGIQGEQGEAGITPVRGVDYFTEEDIDYIVELVLAKINTKLSTLESTIDTMTGAVL